MIQMTLTINGGTIGILTCMQVGTSDVYSCRYQETSSDKSITFEIEHVKRLGMLDLVARALDAARSLKNEGRGKKE